MIDEALTRRITEMVQQALAELNGTPAGGARAAESSPPPAPTTGASLVTVEDVSWAVASGSTTLAVLPGAIVTPLARDEAERLGVRIVQSGHAGQPDGARPSWTAQGIQVADDHVCCHCSSCMQPASYDRRGRPVAATTGEMIGRLDRFTELAWRTEPQDVTRLRQLSRPPMGRIPGIFYACFNLFWAGEEIQTLRDKAKAGGIPLGALNELASSLLSRHAARLSKWYLVDSVELLLDVAAFCEAGGPRDHDEFRELCEHLLLAADRVQAWIDRMLPWHELDARLTLVP
ncbi:MAG: hypothetical protein ACXVY5_05145 [Gaiellales bacterium]